MPIIRITVEGGVVQHVEGVPAGYTAEVWDFDTEGCTSAECERNDNGDLFRRITF